MRKQIGINICSYSYIVVLRYWGPAVVLEIVHLEPGHILTTRYHTHALQVAPFENLVFRWTLLSSGLTRLLGGISGMNWPILLVDMENSDALTIISTLYQIGQLYLLKSAEKSMQEDWSWMDDRIFERISHRHFTAFERFWSRPNQPAARILGLQHESSGSFKARSFKCQPCPEPSSNSIFCFLSMNWSFPLQFQCNLVFGGKLWMNKFTSAKGRPAVGLPLLGCPLPSRGSGQSNGSTAFPEVSSWAARGCTLRFAFVWSGGTARAIVPAGGGVPGIFRIFWDTDFGFTVLGPSWMRWFLGWKHECKTNKPTLFHMCRSSVNISNLKSYAHIEFGHSLSPFFRLKAVTTSSPIPHRKAGGTFASTCQCWGHIEAASQVLTGLETTSRKSSTR